MDLHQDRNENDFSQPIITACLGDAADFMVGGFAWADRAKILKVRSGDILVMGGGQPHAISRRSQSLCGHKPASRNRRQVQPDLSQSALARDGVTYPYS